MNSNSNLTTIEEKLNQYSQSLSVEFTEEKYSLHSEKGERLEGMFYDLIEMQEESLPSKTRKVCVSLSQKVLKKLEGLV